MMYYLVFALVLLTPLAMLVTGLVWRSRPPRRQGRGFAYRTAMTEKNEAVWAFAHRHISKLWIRLGLMLTLAVSLLMIFLPAYYLSFFLWVIGGEMVFLCLSAFLVDGLVKSSFDQNGDPISKP